MEPLTFNKDKIVKVVEAAGCSVQFENTKDPHWCRGFVTDERTGHSIGRITIEGGNFSHIKWYSSSYNASLGMMINEIGSNINEVNEAIHKLNLLQELQELQEQQSLIDNTEKAHPSPYRTSLLKKIFRFN